MADKTDTLAELERLHGAATAALKELGAFDSEHPNPDPFTAAFEDSTALGHATDRAEAALWVASKDHLPFLLKQARLAATLTSILCSEEGQDVVERAKELIDGALVKCFECGAAAVLFRGAMKSAVYPIGTRCADCGEAFCAACARYHFKSSERETIDSLRAALAAKEADYSKLVKTEEWATRDLARAHGTIDEMLEVFSTNPEEYRADPVAAMRGIQEQLRDARAELARMKERVAELERNQAPQPHPYSCECVRCMATQFRNPKP